MSKPKLSVEQKMALIKCHHLKSAVIPSSTATVLLNEGLVEPTKCKLNIVRAPRSKGASADVLHIGYRAFSLSDKGRDVIERMLSRSS